MAGAMGPFWAVKILSAEFPALLAGAAQRNQCFENFRHVGGLIAFELFRQFGGCGGCGEMMQRGFERLHALGQRFRPCVTFSLVPLNAVKL